MDKMKYRIIYDDIIAKIERGEFKAGDRISTECEAAELYGFSRASSKKAYQLLFQDGYIVRKTKLGTFVADKTKEGSAKIAVVLPFEESNNYKILDAIMENNVNYNFSIEVFKTFRNSFTEKTLLENIIKGDYSGVILMPATDTENCGILSRYYLQKIPTVIIDCPVWGVDLPMVVTDNRAGIYNIIKHYIAKGKRKFAYFSLIDHMPQNAIERFNGYCSCLLDNGIQLRDEFIHKNKFYSREFYYAGLEQQERVDWEQASEIYKYIEALEDKPEVLMFNNDMNASVFIKYCKSVCTDIFKEYVICGFDDLEISRDLNFSTVRQNFYTIGKKALETVAMIIEGKKVPQKTIIKTHVVIRPQAKCLDK